MAGNTNLIPAFITVKTISEIRHNRNSEVRFLLIFIHIMVGMLVQQGRHGTTSM